MKPIFIVGSPRSGTTWLQLLLAQFDTVATAQETHLFSRYLGPLRSSWQSSRSESTGLHTVLEEEAFARWCRGIAVQALESIRSNKPGATIPLEKTPSHVLHIQHIGKLLPESRFLHIIRDPRAVTNSLLQVGETWGRDWAPRSPREAAQTWRSHVEAGLRAHGNLGDLYREVKYEDLCRQPVAEVRSLVRWIGMEVKRDECVCAVRACNFERINTEGAARAGAGELRVRPGEGAETRTSRVEAWRNELSGSDVGVVEWEVGDLMEKLGYELVRERRRKPARLVARDSLKAARDGAASLVRSLLRGMALR